LLERLDDLNLQTFGDLAEVPLAPLHLAIGSWAALLARWAHGIDPSPVLPSPVQPQLEESLQLASDEIDDDRLFGYLFALLERLCRTLRRQHRVCHGLLLTLRYNDHIDMTRQEPLTRGTQWEVDLLPHLSGLLQRCFQRRVRIRRLTLGVTGLTEAAEQLSLFDEGPGSGGGSRAKAQRLTMALDHLAERYGEGTVRYGRSLQ
jgi:DNA polymerase-4